MDFTGHKAPVPSLWLLNATSPGSQNEGTTLGSSNCVLHFLPTDLELVQEGNPVWVPLPARASRPVCPAVHTQLGSTAGASLCSPEP